MRGDGKGVRRGWEGNEEDAKRVRGRIKERGKGYHKTQRDCCTNFTG